MAPTVGTLHVCAVLALATVCGCAVPGPFRVLSFNIRYAAADDGPNAWELRRDLAVATIRCHDADILGLQEVLASQAADLRAALPEYGFIGVGRDDGAAQGEFVPVFYRQKRFELVDYGHFWLSEHPDQPGSVGWDAALPRIATWVRLRFKDAPLTEITVVNVHFDHSGQRARRESARMIRRLVESLGGQPLVVLGDFNCPPGSEPYWILTEERTHPTALFDAWAALGQPEADAGTYHAFTGMPREGRIDWILASRRCAVDEVAIDRSQRDGRYPSDHFPVVATLRLPPAWQAHW
jgi:endonuclease/exonuclease/phosphatase family metal-dependent hydrolase